MGKSTTKTTKQAATKSLHSSSIKPTITEMTATISPETKAYLEDLKKKPSPITKLDFSALGIVPKVVPTMSTNSKNSTLKVAIVTNQAFVFRLEPDNINACSWAEKKLFDAVSQKKTWTVDAHIDPHVCTWFDNDIKKVNDRNYGVRLFVINVTSTVVSDASILTIALHIATNLNNEPDNNTETKVDSMNFIWKTDAVWSDIIGTDAALKHLRFKLEPFFPGFYEKHKREIYHHFRPGHFPLEVVRALDAPVIEMILPDDLGSPRSDVIDVAEECDDSEPNNNHDEKDNIN